MVFGLTYDPEKEYFVAAYEHSRGGVKVGHGEFKVVTAVGDQVDLKISWDQLGNFRLTVGSEELSYAGGFVPGCYGRVFSGLALSVVTEKQNIIENYVLRSCVPGEQ